MDGRSSDGMITIGVPLAWNLCNRHGMVMFRKGFVISREDSLRRMLDMDLYLECQTLGGEQWKPGLRSAVGSPAASSPPARNDPEPFQRLDELALSVTRCFTAACEQTGSGAGELVGLAEALRRLFAESGTACIAAIHFRHKGPVSCLHAIYSLFLAELLAPALKLGDEARLRLSNAALTANLGMYEYQDQWSLQTAAFSARQLAYLRRHPELSVQRLRRAGVGDPLWLKIVAQHHEHSDGTGYPKGTRIGGIVNEALVIGLIDRYLSFVMPRAGRKWVHPTTALRRIYQDKAAYGEDNVETFIKVLGVYPPGTSLRLANGEIAVVTEHREGDSTVPEVLSVGTAADTFFDQPVRRHTAKPEYRVKDIYVPDPDREENPAYRVPAW